MHDTLKEAPSVRVDVIEVSAQSRQPLRLLRSRINLECKAVVLDPFDHGCRGICGNLGCARTAAECDFAEENAVRRRKNSQHEIFALYCNPAEWTWLKGFFSRLQISKQYAPCMVPLGFEAVSKRSIISGRVCFRRSECLGQINKKVGLSGWPSYASVDADDIASSSVL